MEENINSNPDPLHEQIPLYALGALTPAEAEEFERRRAAGEVNPEELEEDLQTLISLCEEIAASMPAPRRALKDQVMAAILAQQEPPPPLTQGDQIFIHANEGEWTDSGIPGIRMKVLFNDLEHNRVTLLARLDPGAAYPSHRHMGIEECLVIEGDLQIDGRSLRAGDYTVSFDEKIHIDTHSEAGCLLLLNSPMNDEFLGEDHEHVHVH